MTDTKQLPPATHELKTDPDAFDAVAAGLKTHEIRRDDRGFRVGDKLILRRTESSGWAMKNTGAPLVYSDVPPQERTISHIQRGYGLDPDWCILSFAALAASREGEQPTYPEGETPADVRNLKSATFALAQESAILQGVLFDLLRQVREFINENGEANFWTGPASALELRFTGRDVPPHLAAQLEKFGRLSAPPSIGGEPSAARDMNDEDMDGVLNAIAQLNSGDLGFHAFCDRIRALSTPAVQAVPVGADGVADLISACARAMEEAQTYTGAPSWSPSMTKELGELVARCRKTLRDASLTPSVGPVLSGWKLVPVEPTQVMLLEALDCQDADPEDGPLTEMYHAYKAMLNAAPAAPSVGSAAPAYSGWVWKHIKTGGEYELLGDAKMQCAAPLKDMAEVYVYQGENGQMWATPIAEFNEKFKRSRPHGRAVGSAPSRGGDGR